MLSTRGFLLLVLLTITAIAFSGCAGTPTVVPVKEKAPQGLLRDCPITSGSTETNGQMALLIQSLRQDLLVCNADKKALRDWNALD
jgi:hypothetical protein